MYAVQSFHPGKGAARRNPYEPQMIITFMPMMSVWKLLTTAKKYIQKCNGLYSQQDFTTSL